MKSFLKLFAFIGCVGIGTLLVEGCTVHNYSKPGAAVAPAVSARFQADVELGQAVEGTGEVTRILGLIMLPSGNEYADGVSYGAGGGGGGGGLLASILGGGPSDGDIAKSLAAYNALRDGEYDIIVGARYHVQTDDMMVLKTTKATVYGWGAKVKGVKPIPPLN